MSPGSMSELSQFIFNKRRLDPEFVEQILSLEMLLTSISFRQQHLELESSRNRMGN